MGCNIQSGKQLIPGLKSCFPSQGFDQSSFSFLNKKRQDFNGLFQVKFNLQGSGEMYGEMYDVTYFHIYFSCLIAACDQLSIDVRKSKDSLTFYNLELGLRSSV